MKWRNRLRLTIEGEQATGKTRARDAKLVTEAIPRIGFVATGSFLLHAAHGVFWFEGNGLWSWPSVLLCYAAYALAFVLFWLGVRRTLVSQATPIILVAFVLVIGGEFYLRTTNLKPVASPSDVALFSSYSAYLVLHGENPYTWDLRDAYGVYRASNYLMTPTLDGSSTSVLAYPALHFLLLVPLHALGVEDMRVLQVVALALLLPLLYLRAPPPLRPVILLPLFLNPEYRGFAFGWVSDGVWAFLLAVTIVTWRHRNARAVFYGLACAYKQMPWLLAPFILVRLLLDDRDGDCSPPITRATRFFSITGIVFVVTNAPFMWMDFGAWFRGVFEPVLGQLIYIGPGLSSLTQLDIALLPKSFYSLTSLLVMTLLLFLYAVRFRELRHFMWLFPGVILWFSYRSLQSYFVYWIPLLILALVELLRERLEVDSNDPSVPDRPEKGARGGSIWQSANSLPLRVARSLGKQRRVVFVSLLATAGTVVAAGLLSRTERVEMQLLDMRLLPGSPLAGQFRLLVHNTTERVLTPRFAVQTGVWQPYPWAIRSGPQSLQPEQIAEYVVETDVHYRMLKLVDGGQIVLTDASGDYGRRGTLKLAPEPSLLEPEAVFNSHYRIEGGGGQVPWGWQLQQRSRQAPRFRHRQTDEGLPAVELGLTTQAGSQAWERVSLGQEILFPAGELFGWVFPPHVDSESDEALSSVYGFAFSDGRHRLWVLFGPGRSREGYLADDHYHIYRNAEPLVWSRQSVNLREIYDRLGWSYPPLQRVVRSNAEMLKRVISIQLFVAARDQKVSEEQLARFGPLMTEPDRIAIGERVAATVARRDEYYQAISSHELALRNADRASAFHTSATPIVEGRRAARHFEAGEYQRAVNVYSRLIEQAPEDAALRTNLAGALGAMGRFREAAEELELAIRLAPMNVEAHHNRAVLFERMGDREAAIDSYRTALRYDAQYQPSRRALIRLTGSVQ